MQQIFDKVIGQQNLDTLYTLGLILLLVSLFQGLLGAVRTYLFADTTNRIDITLGAEVIPASSPLASALFRSSSCGRTANSFGRAWVTSVVSLPEVLLTLGLDAVFSVIYVGVMMVYSGVLTAVTLVSFPFSSLLLLLLRLRLNLSCVKLPRKMLPHRLCWLNH